ncbi:family 2 encapsulin nanocompartment cargo protein terpene cyclase [Streptomyces sp. NBC_01408]|uniref:family 2 encapsulin nanocompartment cargo protein terpene cyclase n=1 Tax=Streptomyces sp. NBC_01408 TaxID=2903855 RepID=UPI00224D6E33|nr:family 2 encapsulin nanocompartment cargo protein terpene cyclase [Streptomyces sp. NBC_01408]MCX4695875.1 family 2 encapsulin nanocompartment cargo protein terpene cyclase [Streptomyces sp. NBC_01408]
MDRAAPDRPVPAGRRGEVLGRLLDGRSGLGLGLEPGRASVAGSEGSAASAGNAGNAGSQPSGTGLVIPPLYCPDAVRDDPALGDEVDERLVLWARETGIYADRLDMLRSCGFGRLMMLGHPDCDDPDRLLAAAKCGLAEWSVDDHWVDEGADADPELIGARVALAHAVVDPVRLPSGYERRFEERVAAEPVLRAFRSCLDHLARFATPTQVTRLRYQLAVMFVGYNHEAQWRTSGRRPPVWEYLVHRYENGFFPCMVLTDPVGGYEVPAQEFADARVRRTYMYAGVATCLLNDLYSMAREDPADTNLPNLIAAEEGCTLQEAVNRTAAIHNEIMCAVEAESAALASLGSPLLGRFLEGLWNWMGGAKEWHATSPRYHGIRTDA